jgi:hypothetical protein
MKMLAVAIDDEVFARAEEKAAALQTSVPTVVEQYLRAWATTPDQVERARQVMMAKFASPDWSFAVGRPDDRTQRNARG